jgi:hypothetical protein
MSEWKRKWKGAGMLRLHCGCLSGFIELGEACLIFSPAAVARMCWRRPGVLGRES